MNVPELLGIEVMTPDGRGSILTLNRIEHNQVMKGFKREEMNYAYDYADVEIIKGQYCFSDKRVKSQYNNAS